VATIIQEPVDRNPMTEDWQRFIFRTTIQGGGFMCLLLDNMNTTGVPRILGGSRFEVNGSFFLTEADEEIQGAPMANAVNFIYAVPSGSFAAFRYSITRPSFDPRKGGWMDGTNRAVARVFPTDAETFWDKVLLDSEGAMRANNPNAIPTVGGVLVAEGGHGHIATAVLPPGAYYMQVRGGAGGRGGDGGNGGSQGAAAPGYPGAPGEWAAEPATHEHPFVLRRHAAAYLRRGLDGGHGANGGNGGNGSISGGGGGGGGSGKTGMPSFALIEGVGWITALGGRGGAGGAGGRGGRGGTQLGGAGGAAGAPPAIEHLVELGDRESAASQNGPSGSAGSTTGTTSSHGSGGAAGAGGSAFLPASSGAAAIYRIAT